MGWDCLIHNALVLTMAPGAGPLAHGYVAVQGGKIAAVGQTGAPKTSPPPGSAWTPRGAWSSPGWSIPIATPPWSGSGAWPTISPCSNGSRSSSSPPRRGWLDADKVYRGTLLAAAEMIRGGITTVADGYFFEAAVRRALARGRPAGRGGPGGGGLPGPRGPGPPRNLEVAAEFLDIGRGLTGTGSPPPSSAIPLIPAARKPCKRPRT